MDYETICNSFIAVFESHRDNETKVFVVNHLRNDFLEFLNFLDQNISNVEWHISFNGIAFDAQITHFILDKRKWLLTLTAEKIAEEIYAEAQAVINRSDAKLFQTYYPSKFKIKQIDVFKMNHWDNPAKMSSLKWIQYSMDWFNVEEMPHPHNKPIKTLKELKEVIEYCINDVRSTKQIFLLSKEQIELRGELTKDYKIDLYSASEPRISKELFIYYLQKQLGWDKKIIREMRTHRPIIYLSDCILPLTKFKTSVFQSVLDYFKKTSITSTKDGFKYSIEHKGVKTDYGLGGIHGARQPGVYTPPLGWTIMTSDVISFYPNLAIRNSFHPAHLPPHEFCTLYEWFFDERKKIPKSNPMNYVYKIILNSTYGLSGDANAFLYDPKFTMQITINGQLQLSMLYEMLSEAIPECIPLMQNTDGLEMMIPNDKINIYMKVCEEWQNITRLELEHDEYKKMIIRDVNNYIAVSKKGKVKSKGAFEWEDLDKKKIAVLHKNKSALIIPKAIQAYFIDGIKPEDYLNSNTNIFDYCLGVKSKGGWYYETRELIHDVPAKFKKMDINQKRQYLEDNGWEKSWSDDNWVRSTAKNKEANTGLDTNSAFHFEVQKESVVKKTKLQKIVRYFVSNSGTKMMKCHKDGREIQVEAGKWKQTIANKIDPSALFISYDINKNYYLEEIYKQIDQLEADNTLRSSTQLSLF